MEKRYTVPLRYSLPARSTQGEKLGLFGLSGKHWVSRQKPYLSP